MFEGIAGAIITATEVMARQQQFEIQRQKNDIQLKMLELQIKEFELERIHKIINPAIVIRDGKVSIEGWQGSDPAWEPVGDGQAPGWQVGKDVQGFRKRSAD